MDSVTQMLLGATVAQAGFRRRLGRSAMVVGAAIALVPDLDVVVGWSDTFTNWKHHRGLTHSVFFGPVVGPALGWLAWRWYRWRRGGAVANAIQDPSPDDTLRSWIYLAILALMTHVLIDLPTSYGTQALYPLSDYRFAWNGLGIIDIAYSLILVAALAVGFAARSRPRLAQDGAAGALVLVTAYTLMGMAINGQVEAKAEAQLYAQYGQEARVTAYPTLFQPVYRRVVAERPDEILVGYHSVLSDKPIDWKRFPRIEGASIDAVRATEPGRLFSWFAQNNLYWSSVLSSDGNTIVEASDMRYGVSGDTDLGFWGIRAVVDPEGRIVGPVEPFNRRPSASPQSLSAYWNAILGR
jgi:inner membrane protein